MNCLLIAATGTEIAPFMQHYSTADKKIYIDFDLQVLVTGVGIMASTYSLTNYLAQHKPQLIIMVGIAGTYNKLTELGTVVAVKKDTIADMGVAENGRWVDMFDLKMLTKNAQPYTNKWLVNDNKTLLKRTKLPLVNAVTINQIATQKKAIALIATTYKPHIETMEGAALHYVALQHQIPFVQIRGISNYVGDRNKSHWQIKKAIENSNQVLINLFESL